MKTKAETNMVKTKLLLLLCIIFLINACSLIGKKKETEEKPTSDSELIVEEIDTDNSQNDDIELTEDESPDEDVDLPGAIEDIDDLLRGSKNTPINETSDDEFIVYKDVLRDMQDEITKLRSELENAIEEIYKLKAKSQIWENPFSIYNKEIILTNGSTVYGNITYQDQDILFVETLIGGLTLQRNTVKRVIENVTQLPDSSNSTDATRRDDILEIKKDEDGTIFKPSTKLLANTILLGDVIEEVDFRGNRILSGDVKNIGEARADFVKINFIFRMNWQGTTKSLTAFVRGSKHVFPGSNIESDSSIEIGAVANFELVVPQDFGTFIGYSYSIDWEQYDN